MEHGDSSKGSFVGALGEKGGVPSYHYCLDFDTISTSRYGQAHHAACCGLPMPLQEVQEELATVKAVVTSLEEEAALARS
jgi:hypothetical protein